MTGYRKIQAIKNLEVASVCNLACPYCPARLQGEHRETGFMSEEIFDLTLFWLGKFVRAGTQKELNLFGIGEPFLHPKYVEMVRKCRKVMPRYLVLRLNTNGVLATEELVREVYDAGADTIDITDHDPRVSMMAIRVLRKVTGQYMPSQERGSRWGYSRDGILNPNNWGGLIDWVPSVDHARYVCPWISGGQVMVMSNGDVSRCCQDAFGRGILGTVRDDLEKIDHTPYVQCLTCHEDIPPGMPKPIIKMEKEQTV